MGALRKLVFQVSEGLRYCCNDCHTALQFHFVLTQSNFRLNLVVVIPPVSLFSCTFIPSFFEPLQEPVPAPSSIGTSQTAEATSAVSGSQVPSGLLQMSLWSAYSYAFLLLIYLLPNLSNISMSLWLIMWKLAYPWIMEKLVHILQ